MESRTGYLICLGGCPIIWRSKLQTLISVSTMEAEYVALLMGMRELILLKRIFVDPSNCFEADVKVPRAKFTVFEDNSSAIQLANVPKMTPRSKHIALVYIIISFVNIYEREALAWNTYRRICILQIC